MGASKVLQKLKKNMIACCDLFYFWLKFRSISGEKFPYVDKILLLTHFLIPITNQQTGFHHRL